MTVPEASIADTDHGRMVESEGWFVLNVGQAAAFRNERAGVVARLESARHPFADTGINIRILGPGQPAGRYHSESVQEDFLVLAGECLLIVEDQERHLRAWDFVHCPAGTHHLFVGAGEAECWILMIGARRDATLHYPVDERAARHDGSSPQETDSPREAYADWPHEFTPERMRLPPA